MSDELNPAPLADLTEAAPPATRTGDSAKSLGGSEGRA